MRSEHVQVDGTVAGVIAEKNLAGEPWEFGYAIGVSRPLALAASPEACTLCAENFRTPTRSTALRAALGS